MLIITNGTIVDGTGMESFPGDVVVEVDRIADVVRGGAATRGDAEVIDARGCLVTPGFVDSHAHSDAYLVLEPDAPSKLAQGVTTEVNGQCGGSAAPRSARRKKAALFRVPLCLFCLNSRLCRG